MMPDAAVLINRIRHKLVEGATSTDAGTMAGLIREETQGLISDREMLSLLHYADAEVRGAGPLDALLRNEEVTDVLVNGPQDVWFDRGDGLVRADIDLGDADRVLQLAQRLAARAGRRLDSASPWVDATLPSGARLHAVMPPIARGCAVLSVRTLRRQALTLPELVTRGSMPEEVMHLLSFVVRAKLSFLVSGGTGSGKTTLLSSLLGCVPPSERIIVVEDADELAPTHPHVVKLQSRPPNIEGAGEISLRALVRQSLRMRPDRLIVGEVRGVEVADLLSALNTGHRGGAGTIHANGIHDVPSRLCALGALAGLSADAVRLQARSALQVLIHVDRTTAGVRFVDHLGLIFGPDDGLEVHTVWSACGGFTADAAHLDRLLQGAQQ